MKTIDSLVDNLINGNCKDAKAQAKRYSAAYIADYMHHELGWTTTKAVAAADYLKTGEGFQEYCDAI